jgi:hypothetical protein
MATVYRSGRIISIRRSGRARACVMTSAMPNTHRCPQKAGMASGKLARLTQINVGR